MIPLLRKLGDQFLGLLFPERCAGCGKSGALFCLECQQKIRPYPHPISPSPSRPISHSEAIEAIDTIFIAFLFEGVLREAIHLFKYRPLRRLAIPLGDLMANSLATYPIVVDALMPIPLHPNRLAERGFNQSELLARQIAQSCSIPLLTTGLVRIRDTEHQVRLNAMARRENMRDAFHWKHPTPPPSRIALVDDLFTTGATFRACAVALRAAGAKEIVALALARSNSPTHTTAAPTPIETPSANR